MVLKVRSYAERLYSDYTCVITLHQTNAHQHPYDVKFGYRYGPYGNDSCLKSQLPLINQSPGKQNYGLLSGALIDKVRPITT